MWTVSPLQSHLLTVAPERRGRSAVRASKGYLEIRFRAGFVSPGTAIQGVGKQNEEETNARIADRTSVEHESQIIPTCAFGIRGLRVDWVWREISILALLIEFEVRVMRNGKA